jgi:uncharacterized protein with gpF-like domain
LLGVTCTWTRQPPDENRPMHPWLPNPLACVSTTGPTERGLAASSAASWLEQQADSFATVPQAGTCLAPHLPTYLPPASIRCRATARPLSDATRGGA